MKRKILSIILAFVCILSCGLCFTACNQGDTAVKLGNEQVNELIRKASKAFYSNHKDTENYSAITYHWVDATNTKENDEINYKEHATDTELKTGTFERNGSEVLEITAAIKKEGDHIVAEITAVMTEREVYKDTNADYELEDVDNTYVTNIKYRMFHYVEDSVAKNLLILEKSQTLNGEVVLDETQKLYGSKVNMTGNNSYDSFVEDNIIGKTNSRIKDIFVSINQYMALYQYLISAEQNGDQVKISINYVTSNVNSSWEVLNNTVKNNVYYKGEKFYKADGYSKTESENYLEEKIITFDLTESANVNTQVPTSFAGYTKDNNVWNYFASNINNLPDFEML